VVEPLFAAGKQIQQIREEQRQRTEAGERATPRPAPEAKPQPVIPQAPAAESAPPEPTIILPRVEREEPAPATSRQAPQGEAKQAPPPVQVIERERTVERTEVQREPVHVEMPETRELDSVDRLIGKLDRAEQRREQPESRETPEPAPVQHVAEREPPAPSPQPVAARERPEPLPAPIKPPEPQPIEQGVVYTIRPLAKDPEDRTPKPQTARPAPEEPPKSGAAADNGFRVAPAPGQQPLLEKLITALGPLPEETRALKETLDPLTSLGYTMTELLAAVREMERIKEERTPGVEGARPGEEEEKAPADVGQPQNQPGTKQPRPATQPAQQQAPAPNPPAPNPAPQNTTPAPSPGAASQVVEAEAVESGGAAAAGAAESGAAAAGAAFGPAGMIVGIAAVAVIGTATRAVSGLANAAKSADRALQETAHRLAPYSGALSASLANAQVRQVLLDIERAQRLGPRLAEYNTGRSDLDRAATRIADVLRSTMLDQGTPVVEALARIAGLIAKHGDALEMVIDSGIRAMFPNWSATVDLLKQINKWFKKGDDDKRLPLEADIMGIFGGHPRPFDQAGGLRGMGGIRNPLTPQPIVPGPGVPPGQGIRGI
jgi:hypothetical protein